ncbi:MAG: hypothetical protein HQM08_04455 [Candidatus Riflebacteria bacterium]|nr:hypothetical protein [Candidatus Riflebacteria bacterium]
MRPNNPKVKEGISSKRVHVFRFWENGLKSISSGIGILNFWMLKAFSSPKVNPGKSKSEAGNSTNERVNWIWYNTRVSFLPGYQLHSLDDQCWD